MAMECSAFCTKTFDKPKDEVYKEDILNIDNENVTCLSVKK